MTVPTNRFLMDIQLQPVQGSRFAPTGFPDLGASVFDRPVGESEWQSCLLVESAQSMANRLEAVMWNTETDQPIELITELPYVRIIDSSGAYITSSREEAHRLASAYVRKALLDGQAGSQIIVERLGMTELGAHDYQRMALEVFRLDPFALLHGVFFSGQGAKEFPGQPKFTRVISSFIEAVDVRRAESGGVKRDHVSHRMESSGGDSSDGYGSIPFGRTEWTARKIVGSFNLDLAQLRSYALPEAAAQLLENLARLQVAVLLNQPLRLRSNCDLDAASADRTGRDGTALGTVDELTGKVSALIDQCRAQGLIGETLELVWKPGKGA